MKTFYLQEATMEDSYIYRSFNASNVLVEKIVKFLKVAVKLDASYIEEQYSQIKRTGITPLSDNVLKAYDDGDIELLYTRDAKIGYTIPFIIRKNSEGKIVASIFISSFTTLDKTNTNLVIPVKQLYALMESAYVALKMQIYPLGIQKNITLMKVCCSVYTQMLLRILNKDYALSLDKPLFDKVTYSISRFFLETMWGFQNKNIIDSYALSGLDFLEGIDIDILIDSYNNFGIKDIEGLLNFIRTLSPRLKDLNVRYFIERFVNTYHGSSILSIDYLPYVFFVIINVILGSFLISQASLNDVVKNTSGINKFYQELSKSV